MRAKEKNWSRNSLLISLVVHAIVFTFLALYVTNTVQKAQELVDTVFMPQPKSQKYEPRPQPARPIIRPYASQTQIVHVNIIPVDTLKRSSPICGRYAKTAVLPRSSEGAMQNSGSTSLLTRSKAVPRVMITAQVLPSSLTLPPSVAGGASGSGEIGNRPGTGGGRSWWWSQPDNTCRTTNKISKSYRRYLAMRFSAPSV